MPDEEPTITVDLRDEAEEWVQHAQSRKVTRSDAEVDEESLKTETRRNLQQAVRRCLENLENDILGIETRFELSDHQLLEKLATLVVQRAQNVESIRERERNRLGEDEDVSPFELPRRTREATAEYLVQEAVGKAEIRSLARLLLKRERKVLDTDDFEADTPRTETDWVSKTLCTSTEGESNIENRTRLNSRG